jgi:hypothetical protein
MDSLKNSFEIQECATLLQLLLPPGGVAEYATFDQPQPVSVAEQPARQDLFAEATPAYPGGKPAHLLLATQDASVKPPAANEPLERDHKEDMLEDALQILCQRGRFTSAIIADDQGLALADYNSPVDTAVMAAFATVLGGAIAQASHFLDQHQANNISMDINYADKAVVRKFTIDASPFYLFIICPQDVDERNEVELSLKTIITLLNR